MAKSKVPHQLIPPEQREMTELQTPSNDAADNDEYEEKKFDRDFWLEVEKKVEKTGVSWNRAMDEERVKRLKEDHGKDVLSVIIHKWPKRKIYRDRPEMLPSLEYLVSRLTEIILEQDTEKKVYDDYEVEEEETRPTLLHLAAAQNFLHVTRCLVDHYPAHMYLPDKNSALPVELALQEHKDDTAAYLISQMKYDRVQDLFLCEDESKENSQQPLVKFFFGDIISYRNPDTNEYGMKRTVIAVLDKLIDPHWPYLPERSVEDEDDKEIARALESVPDDPMNYDFHYHILEADENGRQPKIKVATMFDKDGEPLDAVMATNPNFNHKSVSCLRLIADSENKEAIKHPVVRMLVSRKWDKFGLHRWFWFRAILYVLFLLVLSFALIYGSTRDDPTQYKNSGDRLRAVCEIFSIGFLMFHLFDEISEITREGKDYFRVWHNYLDMFGIILTFLVIPLRFAESKYQWTLASLGYIFNVLRLFKFSNVMRTTGLYTTTLVNIIHKDIGRFLMVFAVIFVGFCGAIFMALKVDDLQGSFSNFASLMLAGFRALVEQQPVKEEYSEFGWLTILILLIYMGVVIVILLNILIAQLSYTYSEAKKVAKLQYAADTMRIATRLEYSRFACLNGRVRHYIRGDWISDEDLAKEILEYTEDRHPWESAEDRISDVREIMRKIVRKGKEKEPWETLDERLTLLTERMIKDKETIDEKLAHLTSVLEKLLESKD